MFKISAPDEKVPQQNHYSFLRKVIFFQAPVYVPWISQLSEVFRYKHARASKRKALRLPGPFRILPFLSFTNYVVAAFMFEIKYKRKLTI